MFSTVFRIMSSSDAATSAGASRSDQRRSKRAGIAARCLRANAPRARIRLFERGTNAACAWPPASPNSMISASKSITLEES